MVIDQRPSTCIDEDGLGIHPQDSLSVDKVVSIGGKRTMQRNDVGRKEQLFEVSFLNAIGQCLCRFAGEGFHLHTKSEGNLGNTTSDMAKAHDTEGLA